MEFIKAKTPDRAIEAMAAEITGAFAANRKVLWLICGGSNIPYAVEVMNLVRQNSTLDQLENLTIAQTDERYGPIGHADSNWRQMEDAGFNWNGIKTLPILIGKSLETTVTEYGTKISAAFEHTISSGGLILAQFGMGSDGHVAGMLPHSPAVSDRRPVSGYQGGQYVRITLNPPMLRKINKAYLLVFGKGKEEAVNNLRTKKLSIEEEPVQILKELGEAYMYTDL